MLRVPVKILQRFSERYLPKQPCGAITLSSRMLLPLMVRGIMHNWINVSIAVSAGFVRHVMELLLIDITLK
jgi:hypothetical protein